MGKIIVSMLGGLGNQMFEYAMYLNLLEKYGAEKVGISTSWFILNHAHYGYELEKIFGIIRGIGHKQYCSNYERKRFLARRISKFTAR